MKTFLILFFCVIAPLVLASTNPPDIAISGQSAHSESHFTLIRDYLELAYFVATIAIAIFALLALKQIRLARLHLQIASDAFVVAKDALVVAKDDIKIRSRREAIGMAAKHCQDFPAIMEKIHKWRGEFATKGVALNPNWAMLNKTFDDTSLKDQKAAQTWVQQVQSKQLTNAACHILNQCEAFAIYFAAGAADEEVAFPVVGAIFCQNIETFAPWLIMLRVHQDTSITSGKYANTVRLYEIWSDRMRREEIEAQQNRAHKELGSLKNEKIQPIGY